MTQYRTVVIGAGAIAKTHLRALRGHDRTQLTAIADINLQRAEELAGEYGIKAYADYKEMVQAERPDIVIITLPHFLHKESTIWCAAQGCHILLEKPMAMNVQECDEMIEMARQHGVMLAVGHIQRFFPANQKARELVQAGTLGKLVMIVDRRWSHYFNENRPAWFLEQTLSGGGIVINLGSHSIDKIQWLTGERVTKVKASMTWHGERGNVEGSAGMLLQTSGGVIANVSLSGYHHMPINETELLFTGGQLKLAGQSLLISDHTQKEYTRVDLSDMPDAFTAQWNELLDSIEHATPLGISGEYGRSVASVVAAAYRSHHSGTEQDV